MMASVSALARKSACSSSSYAARVAVSASRFSLPTLGARSGEWGTTAAKTIMLFGLGESDGRSVEQDRVTDRIVVEDRGGQGDHVLPLPAQRLKRLGRRDGAAFAGFDDVDR